MQRTADSNFTRVVVRWMVISVLVFLLITLGEHLAALVPRNIFAGPMWGLVSVVVWIVLTRRFLTQSRSYARTEGVVVSALLIGAVSGFAGAFAGWLLYATGNGVPFGHAVGIGSLQLYGFESGLTTWPIVGAAVCGITALIGRRA
jgi:hypothetical protein